MPRGESWRLLYFAYPSAWTVPLDIDVALCFGDVARVFIILSQDDAELDQPPDPHTGEIPDRHLLPPGHKRTVFIDGLPEPDSAHKAHIIFAGASLGATRQICEHSGLQRESTLWVVVTGHQGWQPLPRRCRPHPKQPVDDRLRHIEWELPSGWDDGLDQALKNRKELQLLQSDRSIAGLLGKIHACANVRLVEPFVRPDTQELEWRTIVVDKIGTRAFDAGIELYIAITPPRGSVYDDESGRVNDYIIHVQLPALYPLASARLRMITPIVHPLIMPFWPEQALIREIEGNKQGECIRRIDGGRIIFLDTEDERGYLVTALYDVIEGMSNPIPLAERMLAQATTPEGILAAQWLNQGGNGGPMLKRALAWKRLVNGRSKWNPDIHHMCPPAFINEVKQLLLTWRRAWTSVPMEIVWLIIDALLRLHLRSCFVHDWCKPDAVRMQYRTQQEASAAQRDWSCMNMIA